MHGNTFFNKKNRPKSLRLYKKQITKKTFCAILYLNEEEEKIIQLRKSVCLCKKILYTAQAYVS